MKLSIVIPSYNIQSYIAQCLDSCINVTDVDTDNYEIIVVNDGSTDNTLDIAEDYSRRHRNLKVVTRKNGGLSAARNTGLQNAKGDYVWFVDGDDYITTDAISTILHDIEAYGCDILTYGYNKIIDGECVGSVRLRDADEILNAHDEFMKCNFGFPMLVWTHVYHRNYLLENDLYFCEGLIHEDMEFKFRSHFRASSVLLSSSVVYNYRMARPDSIMSNAVKNPQRSIDANDVILNRFLEYCEVNVVPEYVKKAHLGDITLLSLERIYDQNNSIIVQNRDKVKKLCSYLWYSGNAKRRIYAAICYCCPVSFARFLQHYYQNKL